MEDDEKNDHNPSQHPRSFGYAQDRLLRGGDHLENNQGTWSALSLAWELGYTIAIPIVAFALVGRVLDQKLDSSPWLLLIGIFLSILASSWLVYFKMVKIIGK